MTTSTRASAYERGLTVVEGGPADRTELDGKAPTGSRDGRVVRALDHILERLR